MPESFPTDPRILGLGCAIGDVIAMLHTNTEGKASFSELWDTVDRVVTSYEDGIPWKIALANMGPDAKSALAANVWGSPSFGPALQDALAHLGIPMGARRVLTRATIQHADEETS